ncbi:MAG: 1-phosphofructokinase family hexose kinase [Actinomycetes bacterium]
MIVTVTLNPSLDRTIEIGCLTRGAMVRATGTRLDAGGKGVNVARALAEHQAKTRAVLPLGGPDGDRLMGLLALDGIDVVAVPVAASTRSNVSLVEPDGTVTKVNEPGGVLRPVEVESLVEAVLTAAGGAEWVVLCGSLPPGVSSDVYARLTQVLGGTSVAVDSSGSALRASLPANPALVKPNRDELAESVGRPIHTLGDVLAAAELLRADGADAVLASLGSDGALLLEDDGPVYGRSTVTAPRSTVGAGDAMLAGFLAAGGHGPAALEEALAWGAAAVSLPGSRMPASSDIRREDTHVSTRIDPTHHLTGPH